MGGSGNGQATRMNVHSSVVNARNLNLIALIFSADGSRPHGKRAMESLPSPVESLRSSGGGLLRPQAVPTNP
jgi:hypothetical protein